MGARIFVYAVDLPRLDAFLDASLADLLCRYVRDGKDPNNRLIFTHGDNCDTFAATPKMGVAAALTNHSGRKYVALTEEQLQTIPTLRQSAREHISKSDIYQSKWLFAAFSNCAGINFIRGLIDGHRRWWIGSLLQFAMTTLPDDTYTELEHLFGKILRGANCGFPNAGSDVGFATDGLPFTPENAPDIRFGRWTQAESLVALELLSEIMCQSPRFTPPPGPLGITPDDAEWHDWVQRNVTSLLQLADLEYNVCNVLTFIDT